MKLTLISKKKQTRNITSFIFKPARPFSWKAGQYLIAQVDHEKQDLRGKMRFFTISSAPFEKNLVITTKVLNKRASSFKSTLNNLNVGDYIEGKGPDGDVFIEDSTKNHIFIAGGLGITPFRSILKQLDFENVYPNITLLYANKNKSFLYLKDILESSKRNPNFNIKYFISPKKITKNSFLKTTKDFKNTYFFISGPEKMIDQIEDIVLKLGANPEKIKKDYYAGYLKI